MGKKILFVRTDNIGDVISITPAAKLLKEAMPQCEIYALVKPYTAPILQDNPCFTGIIETKPTAKETAEILKQYNFDTAILFFVDKFSALSVYKAEIKERIGPFSKIWSLLLNKRIKQNRSKTPNTHESDFNLQLLAPLGVPFKKTAPLVCVSKNAKENALQYLNLKHGIQKGDKFICVHPGSKGSAKDWPPKNYRELITLINNNLPEYKILVTAGPGEFEMARYVTQNANNKVSFMQEAVSLETLKAILEQASLLITNSTGPLHIAVGLGTKTVSFFPPLKGCLPDRWGPYAQGHIVLMPNTEDFITDINNGMKFIKPEQALEAVKQQLCA